MDLVKQYQGRRMTVVTTDMNGITREKEVMVGNSKGILLIKAGDHEHQCSHSEVYEIHRTVCECLKKNEEDIVITVPGYVSMEYIKLSDRGE